MIAALSIGAFAQNPSGGGPGVIPVQLTSPAYAATAITATGAVNVATVLTIPAPAGGQFNYVCSLAYELNSDVTGGAISNVASSSTNFGTFVITVSMPLTVNIDSGLNTIFQAQPGFGCVKSAAAGTATTFTAPASSTHIAWTWYATYYQAP